MKEESEGVPIMVNVEIDEKLGDLVLLNKTNYMMGTTP